MKIAVYVPESHADIVRKTLAENGCGHIGDYDSCSFTVKGIGRFRPLDGAEPFIGEIGKMEEVSEDRIETICPIEKLDIVLQALKEAHPYDEPAVDIYPLLNN